MRFLPTPHGPGVPIADAAQALGVSHDKIDRDLTAGRFGPVVKPPGRQRPRMALLTELARRYPRHFTTSIPATDINADYNNRPLPLVSDYADADPDR